MPCIVWQLADGQTYLMKENEPHTPAPGSFNTGEVKWDCGNSTPADEVDVMLEKSGLKLGDSVAWVTKKLGIKQCAPCKARQEILNNVTQLGWLETIKQIKETL